MTQKYLAKLADFIWCFFLIKVGMLLLYTISSDVDENLTTNEGFE